ncbi:hypothetical protein BZG02_04035 [Labilibaculum filiforme]|uniref:HTH lacI-type domain-containing protein n=1 Tax=Labilibaculum filiforme TaxID=1940526 RepID=A0A2N3I3Y3_9BACT|nr:LacI family DNA-binding transcriptional regulator [Labilibaculum filiforme]PKQ65015.1 hypothetical protein BZG02_04035 [Labilibaculum filiforme]
MKKVSIKDIAQHLNVSVSAVSLTLNGKGDEKRISKTTQKRIVEYAQEQNYRPNSFAKGLQKGKSEIIGLVVPNISDVFFSRIARRIEKQAEQAGYDVIFSSTGENIEKESKKIQSMLDRQVDGLIIASCQKNTSDILKLKQNNFPFVLIDRLYPEIETNYVGFDNVGGVSSAVNQLIQAGRKRIGFVTLSMNLGTIRERLDSYLQTMKEHALPVENGFVHEMDYNNDEADMQNVIREMLKKPCNIEAIVFATHFLASEGLRQLKELNIRVPDDVAIVSYGEQKDFDLFEPAITAVNLPINEMGDKAVDILLRNMKETNFSYEQLRLKTELVVRKSCGAK